MRHRLAGRILASVALMSCADLSSLTGGRGDAANESGRDDEAGASACIAGRSLACTGPGGCAGGQACNAAGTAYEACLCEGRDGEAPPREGGANDARDATHASPKEIQSQTVALEAASSTATITLGSAVAATDTLILPVVNYATTINVSSISGGGGTWAVGLTSPGR